MQVGDRAERSGARLSERCLLGFLPLKSNENMLATGCGRKLGGPFLARWSEAQLSGFLTEFVNPQVLVAFPFSLCWREVDGLGLLRGVDGTGSFADLLVFRTEAPCPVRAVDHREFLCVLVLCLVAIDLKGNDSPCAFVLLPIFLDRFVLGITGCSNRTNRCYQNAADQEPEE